MRLLTSRSESRLMRLNLTQWRTLTLIRFNPNETQRTLSKAVGVDPSSMTPIIDFFEKKGWVRRHDSRDNRSAYQIRMTAEGTVAYAQIEKEMARVEELFERLLGSQPHRKLAGLMLELRTELARELAASETRLSTAKRKRGVALPRRRHVVPGGA